MTNLSIYRDHFRAVPAGQRALLSLLLAFVLLSFYRNSILLDAIVSLLYLGLCAAIIRDARRVLAWSKLHTVTAVAVLTGFLTFLVLISFTYLFIAWSLVGAIAGALIGMCGVPLLRRVALRTPPSNAR